MKAIQQFIFEASGKPSDLKKYKKKERKETVHFKGGDMFDTHDPGYDEEFTYYSGEGNGYIKDKEGHVYDVVASDHQGDAGRIAGGSHDYYVTIKKANGTDDFYVHGYVGIMSRGSNAGCISDIKAGYYLEDYIAKYYSQYSHGDKFKELAEKGNKDAKPYEKEQEEKRYQKVVDFYERYVVLPETLSWEIDENGFKFIWWNLSSRSKKELQKEKDEYIKQNFSGKFYNDYKDDEQYKKFEEELKKNQTEFDELVQGILKPILINRLQEVFKTKDINLFKGIGGTFGYKKFVDKSSGDYFVTNGVLAVDTKTKDFVTLNIEKNKVLKDKVELQLGDAIKVNKGKASDKVIQLFKKVSDAWKKQEGKKQTEYVKNNWEAIYNKSAYGWGNHSMTKGQAKEEAKKNFIKMVRDHNFDDPYANNKVFTYSLSLVQVYVEGDMEPDDKPIENPLDNPENKTEKKEEKLSKGTQSIAYDKMKAWHEGTRKQNLKACSDAKLKMNYKVCKELGYDEEMKKIEDEAKSRNLTLESMISIEEYIKICEEQED